MFDLEFLMGISKQIGYYLLIAISIMCLAFAVHKITQRYILKGIRLIISKLPPRWRSIASKGHVFKRASLLLPVAVIYALIPVFFHNFPTLVEYISRGLQAYLIFISLLVFSGVINSIYEIYQTFPVSREKPIKGLLQILKCIVFALGVILIISRILGQSPGLLLGSLGALTAVLLLVFKDPLLGFVGGFQLAANNMVSVGDWIEMPKHGANGNVIDISITSVKVRNFDKTITSIPTYALTAESFKNWQGMFESGGRRIKRAILIDQHTIKFCDQEMLDKFKDHRFLSKYIEELDGEKVTNLGLLRHYVQNYLEKHEKIHSTGMLFLIRHLEPTENGLPLEIYVFTKDTLWRLHEEIQAEVFEHIIAMMAEFELSIFQSSVQVNTSEYAAIES